MSFLVDTNIFSEPLKPKPDPKIVAWLREHEDGLYVSAITIGELRRGIERLPNGRRRTQLRARGTPETFRGYFFQDSRGDAHQRTDINKAQFF